MRNNSRSNAEQRRHDYEIALEYYLSLPLGAPEFILFCENSGADLGSLKEISRTKNPYNRRVEFFSFVSDIPPEMGKSPAELDIMNRAHDEYFALFEDCMIWKVTGRLMVLNFQEISSSRPIDAELYCDTRSVRLLGKLVGANFWVDTRLIGFTPRYYNKYIRNISSLRENSIEAGVYDSIRPYIFVDKGIRARFKIQPLYRGICAGSGADYETGSEAIKTAIRRVSRILAPRIWI